MADAEVQELKASEPDASQVNSLVDSSQQYLEAGDAVAADIIAGAAYFHSGQLTLPEILDNLNSSYSAHQLAAAYARVKGIDLAQFIN